MLRNSWLQIEYRYAVERQQMQFSAVGTEGTFLSPRKHCSSLFNINQTFHKHGSSWKDKTEHG